MSEAMTAVLHIKTHVLKPDEVIVFRSLLERTYEVLGQCVEALDGVEEERKVLVNFCRAWDAGIAADAEPFDALCAAIEASHTAGRASLGLKPFFLQSTGRLLGYASDRQFFAADWAVQKANEQSFQDGHNAGYDEGYDHAVQGVELGAIPVHAVGDDVPAPSTLIRRLMAGCAAVAVLAGTLLAFSRFPFVH